MTMKTEKRYHGVVVPMVTPVTCEGDIDVTFRNGQTIKA